MGLQLAAGRWLTAQDVASGARVAVVSETFARKYITARDPLGRQLKVGPTALEVVGMLRDVRTVSVDAAPKAEFFTSYHLARAIGGRGPERLTLAVRTSGDPMTLLPYLRAVLFQLDPALALEDVKTMNAKLSASEAEPRFYALLLGVFAGIALILASAGVYGVLAYSVARQTRALGVRRALGARGKDILAMIFGRGLGLVAAGIVIGFGIAAAATKVLSHLLFGITTRDPLSYLVAALSLLAVGVVACYLPARRATRIDPIEALRFDG
jgi:predicted lysophospholipase L1 biosynthesis ABC-type transport system permease subunit